MQKELREEQARREYHKGLIYVLLSMIIWGVLPIYWQALRPIDSGVVIFYRIFLVGLVSFVAALKVCGWKEIKKQQREKGIKLKLFIAGLLITGNWSIYIWAVNAEHVIQCCIGYYIEPLVVCVFGIILFKERLTKYKTVALILACMGVIIILIHFKEIPFIALGLSLTFAVYAAIKKSLYLPPLVSLLFETMFLAPIALAVILYLEINGKGAISVGEPWQIGILLLAGVITAVPLALFGGAVNRVPMIALGIVEYVAPSISLLIGIFLFKEPFDHVQFVVFAIIWVGLIYFTYGEIKGARRKEDAKT